MEYVFEEDVSCTNQYFIQAKSKKDAQRKFDNGEWSNHVKKYEAILETRRYVAVVKDSKVEYEIFSYDKTWSNDDKTW